MSSVDNARFRFLLRQMAFSVAIESCP